MWSINTVLFVLISYAGRTTADDSLFVYDTGSSHATYVDSSFEPVFVTSSVSSDAMDAANRMCGGSQQCVFDYLLTGKESLALNSAEIIREHEVFVEASKHGRANRNS